MKSMKSVDLSKDLPGNPWIYPQKCGFQMKKDLKVPFRCNYKKLTWEVSDCHFAKKKTNIEWSFDPIQFYN